MHHATQTAAPCDSGFVLVSSSGTQLREELEATKHYVAECKKHIEKLQRGIDMRGNWISAHTKEARSGVHSDTWLGAKRNTFHFKLHGLAIQGFLERQSAKRLAELEKRLEARWAHSS